MLGTTARCPVYLREWVRRHGSDPARAYGFLAAAVHGHLRGERHPEWLGVVVAELDAAMAGSDAVVYTPPELNALIDQATAPLRAELAELRTGAGEVA
ncbi:hypothetical protein [Prauserella endophytica]|uniref:Uncharacterized protein n=1 Tax=Prauserella endophytica TaxID=1592324 RepID=A0ABY2S0C2_9PSEU|nr:hypothetical protein [Prauserella endophytica]TKG67528.1 hypothetical protein FCN18_22465 [Prauserella endophytica]